MLMTKLLDNPENPVRDNHAQPACEEAIGRTTWRWTLGEVRDLVIGKSLLVSPHRTS